MLFDLISVTVTEQFNEKCCINCRSKHFYLFNGGKCQAPMKYTNKKCLHFYNLKIQYGIVNKHKVLERELHLGIAVEVL